VADGTQLLQSTYQRASPNIPHTNTTSSKARFRQTPTLPVNIFRSSTETLSRSLPSPDIELNVPARNREPANAVSGSFFSADPFKRRAPPSSKHIRCCAPYPSRCSSSAAYRYSPIAQRRSNYRARRRSSEKPTSNVERRAAGRAERALASPITLATTVQSVHAPVSVYAGSGWCKSSVARCPKRRPPWKCFSRSARGPASRSAPRRREGLVRALDGSSNPPPPRCR